MSSLCDCGRDDCCMDRLLAAGRDNPDCLAANRNFPVPCQRPDGHKGKHEAAHTAFGRAVWGDTEPTLDFLAPARLPS